MQPSSMLGAGAAHGVSGVTACLSSAQVAGLADHMNAQQLHFSSQFDQASQPHNQAMDDFIEQMLSMPSWPDVAGGKVPWECNNNVTTNPNNNNNTNTQTQKLFTMSLMPPGIGTQGFGSQENDNHGADSNMQYSFDESLLACRLRQHHLSGNNTGINSTPNQASSQGGITESTSPGRSMVLQLSTGNASASQLLASIGNSVMTRSPSSGGSSGSEGGMLPLPLSLGQGKPCDSGPNEALLPGERSREVDVEASFKTANAARDSSPGGIFTTFCGTPVGPSRTGGPIAQQLHPQPGQVPMPSYGGMPQPQHQHQHQHQTPPVPSAVAAPTRPRVRARRGQATDPHSIAERLRRERIAERMKALQELVPNSNKTDKASMLDEIIDYVKFLQLQVKVLSMSRLGGAAAVAPLVADIPSEGGSTPQATSLGRSNGSQSSSQDGLALTERQVAKLMEEDMGSAMQYLQGKGLCLMPISLATAISSSGASRSQSAPLQGLLASNAGDRQIVETTNSSLSTSPVNVQATISSPEADNANKVGNGTRIKESREAKPNGLGPSHPKNAVKGEDEPQRMTMTMTAQ